MSRFSFEAADDAERHSDEMAFDAVGAGFFYYPDIASHGIPVSAEERALYVEGQRKQFFLAVGGRPATGPKRNRLRTYIRFLAGLPAGLTGAAMLFSVVWARQAFQAEPGVLRHAGFGAAMMLAVFAMLPVLARWRLQRSERTQ